MRKNSVKFVSIILLTLILAGCNLPTSPSTQPSGNAALTAAAETVSAQLTLNALNQGQSPTNTQEQPQAPTNTQEQGQAPTNTQQPSNTPEPTDTQEASPTPTERPCNKVEFIKDVTIEDGTELSPGETFTKTWRVKNIGTCTWNDGYDIVFGSGDSMSGAASTPITSGTVAPNETVDMSVNLVAPDEPGEYKGTWQLRDDEDDVFTTGGFWVIIEVVEPETYSSKASFKIDQTWDADLDDGSSPASDVIDFWFGAASDDDKYFDLVNGAKMRLMGGSEPDYADCLNANLKSDDIAIDNSIVGKWFCYITDEGRLGKFKVLSLTPNDITDPQTLEIKYTTWKKP